LRDFDSLIKLSSLCPKRVSSWPKRVFTMYNSTETFVANSDS
jgi:hypothetical protein